MTTNNKNYACLIIFIMSGIFGFLLLLQACLVAVGQINLIGKIHIVFFALEGGVPLTMGIYLIYKSTKTYSKI